MITTPQPFPAKPHIIQGIEIGERPSELTLLVQCFHCYKLELLRISIAGFYQWTNGHHFIQDALPNLTADEREFLITGICPDCWEDLMGSLDD